jgi:NADH:ubiquinone oxidoreductase subunit 5 (subunit L)/multisubunit Na+/H+ antiporter MnhA subunit
VHSPRWAYLCMLIGVGITALYSVRMISMIFYGERKYIEATNDAPPAMRVSLSTLSLAVFTTWLMASAFGNLLSNSLPFHQIQTLKVDELVLDLIAAPSTWLALLIVLIGFLFWTLRTRLRSLLGALQPLVSLTEAGFGFEQMNQGVVQVTKHLSSILRITQTGQLNWNVVGIVGGLCIVLTLLAWGV